MSKITDTERVKMLRQGDNGPAIRAAEILNLPARYIELGEPIGKKAAENIARNFSAMTNVNDGRTAILPMESIGKILRHKEFDFSRIIKDIPELYTTSLLGWSEPEILKDGHKAHSNIKEYHQYVNKFTDGDSVYYIRFTVNEEWAKPKRTARNLIHSAAVSDITVYKKGDHSRHIQLLNLGEASPSPFVDRKLQEFFDQSSY